MGYMRHHAIIVTCFDKDKIKTYHTKAEEIFNVEEEPNIITPIIGSVTNGYYTFFIAPDGSKEWWDTSDEYERRRDEFIHYLNNKNCSWALVQYGDEEGINEVLKSS